MTLTARWQWSLNLLPEWIRREVGDREIVVSVSGGKDSTATALHLKEVGLPFRAVHLDTGWEHRATVDYIHRVLPEVIGPIDVVRRLPSLDPRRLAMAEEIEALLDFRDAAGELLPSAMVRWILRKGMFSSRKRRFCTQELKVFMARDYLAGLEEDAVNVVGIRREEGKVGAACKCGDGPRSPDCRLHTVPWEWSDTLDCWVWRPLTEWSIQDVVDIHQRHACPPNPLYTMGANRVGCWPCVFARKAELRMLATITPERVAVVERLEAMVGDLATERADAQGKTLATGPSWFQSPRPLRVKGWRCSACKAFVAGADGPSQDPCLCGGDWERFTKRLGTRTPIADVITWSRTADGSDDYEPLAPDPSDGGCMRWGFCDTGWRGDGVAVALEPDLVAIRVAPEPEGIAVEPDPIVEVADLLDPPPRSRLRTLGSVFSRIGGLDLAVEAGLGVRTVWQLDLVGEDVRARHWPAARQIVGDIQTVDPTTLPRVDVLCGGFVCKDLSTAGPLPKGEEGEIPGSRSGLTYRELCRLVAALEPQLVVVENVARLLTKHRAIVERDFAVLGYGVTWVKCRALDVGAPHLRARVFVFARRGGAHQGVLDAPRDGAWTPEADEVAWATACARDFRTGSRRKSKGGKSLSEEVVRPWATAVAADAAQVRSHGGRGNPSLTEQVRPWPTAMAADGVRGSLTMKRGNVTLKGAVAPRPWPTATGSDAKASGAAGYSTASGRHSGMTLTDAIVRPWATAVAADARSPWAASGQGAREGSDGLAVQVRPKMDRLQRLILDCRPRREARRGCRLKFLGRDLVFVRAGMESPRGETRPWATATATNPNEGESLESHARRSRELVERGSRPLSEPLALQVSRPWATACGRDWKNGQLPSRTGGAALPVQVDEGEGSRLNPDWEELLMGVPVGWTRPQGPSQHAQALAGIAVPIWPRGRYPKGWEGPWPGFAYEPPRTLPDGPPIPGRPARIESLGNMVVPAQGALACRTVLASPGWADLVAQVVPPPETAVEAVPWVGQAKSCPRCGLEGDVVDVFGFRRCRSTRKDGVVVEKVIPQSYCRACRGKKKEQAP